MTAVLTCAALTAVGAVLVGQLVLRVCGVRRFSWLAPAVGVSGLIILTVPALHLPGRTTTTFVLVGAAMLVGAASMIQAPAQRPPVAGLCAGVPAFVLGLVPFLANGRAGTLGVSFNNDMASHLAWAEAYRSEAIARILTLDANYPLGPHALVGALADGLGTRVDLGFAGLTLAVPVLLAWTAQAGLVGAGLAGRLLVGALVGMPFLVAGYYGQGSFKELLQALFVLAFALALVPRNRLAGPLRWVPVAFLVAGTVSVYSFAGVVWPLAAFGLWLAGLVVLLVVRRQGLRRGTTAVRGELPALALGFGALLLILIPQLPRVYRFLDVAADVNGTGLAEGDLGNLAGRIPLWPVFGAWDNPDYRLPPLDPFSTGGWTALFLALTVAGAAWWVRRGEWQVPAAAGGALALWVLSDATQSVYAAAKALVILTPLVFLVLAVMLAERDWARPSWWRLAVVPVSLVVLVKAMGSSADALQFSKVGSSAHRAELQALQPMLGEEPTLYLGNSDFIRWELAGTPVRAPVISFTQIPTRPEKAWEYGQPFDLDSVDAATLNTFRWIVAPRDPVGSRPRPGLRRVRTTRSFVVFERTRPLAEVVVLPEGSAAGAVLDCATPEGRALAAQPGTAVVRQPPAVVDVPPLAPGATGRVVLRLPAGTWDLATPYVSERAVEIRAPGLRTTLPANLDRPGTRWPIGRLTLSRPTDVPIRIHVTEEELTPVSAVAYLTQILAARADDAGRVPVRRACGRFVDHVLPGR